MMKRYLALILASGMPLLTHAAEGSFADLTDEIVGIVNGAVIPLIYALAFVLFLIGMLRFFFLGGEEGREKGRQFMIWGVIGFVVIFSVWGIVKLLLATLTGA